MATSRARTILFVAVPALILMLPLSVYFVDSAAASEKVARNITIAGVDVSRLTETEAIAALDGYTSALTNRVVVVEVKGNTYDLDPADVGLRFDREGAVDEALGLRKVGIGEWLTAFTEDLDIPLPASLDPDLVEQQIAAWERDAIANPAFEGAVSISDGRVTSTYPKSGESIDRGDAESLLLKILTSQDAQIAQLPIVQIDPALTDEDIDAAVDRAKTIIARGVVLTNVEYGFEFRVEPADLGRALRVSILDGGAPSIEFSVDGSAIIPLVEVVKDAFEIAPVDARWETVLVDDFEDYPDQYEIKDSTQDHVDGLPNNDTITLVPGLNGTTVDPSEIASAVETAALGNGTGTLTVVKNAEPAFTTEMAEAFGELYELAEFTTRTPGTNRVHNIQLMADIVDQSIIMPGEEFSVNERVGERTLAKGFKYDCAIVGGELSCEEDRVNIGGGVSQFGTTIFNAIYFSCLEIVKHQPHSIYFRKYPEGREATLGFPLPDVVFRNNTGAPVIIRTSYTPRTITVTFFGNNDGKTCGTERGERTGFRDAVVIYRADEDGVIPPGEEHVANKGSGGWSIVNWRIFYDADAGETSRERFPWTYKGERRVILMHPCEEQVGGDGVCPIAVPSVAGTSQSAATETLTAAGFTVTVVSVPTDDQTRDGIVKSSSPSGYADAGTAITIEVWNWNGSTTTTTAP